MRRSTSAVVLVGPILVAGVLACGRAAPPRASNLLLITLDTLRADHLGAYGYDRPTSPALDIFAAQSTLFEDVTCSVPTTLPSHATIFTGLRPLQHGIRRNGERPPRDLVTLFDLLRERGAATAAVIAARVLGETYLEGMGFDEVIFPGSERQYQARAQHVTAHALSWLERPREGPFALWLHYYDPHEPYTPPRRLARAFDRGYTGELPDSVDLKTLVGLNNLPPGELPSPGDVAHITDLYDAEIAYLDAHLGRLFDRLEVLGLLDDTLVAIVGDHGQALGESSFFGHGKRLLEPVVKVPLILRLPGQTAPRRVADPVETIDLFPTVAELFGLRAPAGLPGRSLTPALTGEALAAPRFRIIERRHYPDQPEVVGVALHGGDWKAVYYHDEDGSETRWLGRRTEGLDAVNLYDPASDEARWLETARKGLQAAGDEPASELDEEQRRILKALGYLD